MQWQVHLGQAFQHLFGESWFFFEQLAISVHRELQALFVHMSDQRHHLEEHFYQAAIWIFLAFLQQVVHHFPHGTDTATVVEAKELHQSSALVTFVLFHPHLLKQVFHVILFVFRFIRCHRSRLQVLCWTKQMEKDSPPTPALVSPHHAWMGTKRGIHRKCLHGRRKRHQKEVEHSANAAVSLLGRFGSADAMHPREVVG
mmetsp:Transcript_8811/g.54157  ORF Transcript_8811/g.54157 Transcript_8811/m.54157 type:complete len:200 (-) Transcript_8811:1204-1803(-)